jgi:hypothetical protein
VRAPLVFPLRAGETGGRAGGLSSLSILSHTKNKHTPAQVRAATLKPVNAPQRCVRGEDEDERATPARPPPPPPPPPILAANGTPVRWWEVKEGLAPPLPVAGVFRWWARSEEKEGLVRVEGVSSECAAAAARADE